MMDLSHLVVSIDSQRNGEIVIIRPRIDNPTPLTLQYRMTVQKHSPSGQSSSNQQGDFETGTTMASVSVNLPADATCQVHLQVLEQNTVIKEIDSACDGSSAER